MARNTKLVKIAKTLRQRMTKAESVLWQELRDNQLGMKFRRQMPFVFGNYHYITDFYCPKLKLIIEIDGGIHNDPEVKEIDDFREDVFKTAGYKVIRFKNEEIIDSLNQVIEKIKREIQ
jgi:cyclase